MAALLPDSQRPGPSRTSVRSGLASSMLMFKRLVQHKIHEVLLYFFKMHKAHVLLGTDGSKCGRFIRDYPNFRSIYGRSHLTEVDLMNNFSRTGLLENFHLIKGCSANQCIPTAEESPLSEHKSSAGRIPPSIFFNQPAG